MIDIIVIVLLAIMGIRIANTVRKESDIFNEFKQPKTIGWLAILFPAGPVIYITTAYRHGWLVAVVLMAMCYIPALVSAKKRITIFDHAGTDRVKNAMEVATQAYGTAIGGLVYTAILLAINIVATAKG